MKLPSPACFAISLGFAGLLAAATHAQIPERITPAQTKEEAILYTPAGFTKVGEPRWGGTVRGVIDGRAGHLELIVRDADTNQPLPCRVNVVARDGNFYHPPPHRLQYLSQVSTWSHTSNHGGNRIGKAPYRYLGRFFYTLGETRLLVPDGAARIELWRGYEYRPETIDVQIPAGGVKRVEAKLTRVAPMASAGYYAGDTHLHTVRLTDEDERFFFDMLDVEDVSYGVNMTCNWVPTPLYRGQMDALLYPQRAIGRPSIATRGTRHVISGQEYRTLHYGHLNISLRDDLVEPKRAPFATDTWPVHGVVARETIDRGGFAYMAHGGYDQEIYADAALGNTSGIELLQFAIYRQIGLENWYHILNSGWRFSAHGASDYPGARFLSDCRTYVHHATAPTMEQWLAGMAAGRSFFTTGPLLLLEVDGQKPGSQIQKSGAGSHSVRARVRMRCEVTPVTHLDLIVNGAVVKQLSIPAAESKGRWIELEHPLALTQSSWIAARAHSKSPGGEPDAEAHTNPVFVYLNNRAPFRRESIDAWIAKVDVQSAFHAKREFAEQARVLAYFQGARDFLVRVRDQGGLRADDEPVKLAAKLAPR